MRKYKPPRTKPYTIEIKYANGDRIKMTQNIGEYNTGHYFYYIQNKYLNIIDTGYSTASPKDKLTTRDLRKIYRRWRSLL